MVKEPKLSDRDWLPISEVLGLVGHRLYPSSWTGKETQIDLKRAPKITDENRDAVERYKDSFLVLLDLLFSGKAHGFLRYPEKKTEKDIDQTEWPDPKTLNLENQHFEKFWLNGQHFKEFWLDGQRFEEFWLDGQRFEEFWFDVWSNRGKLKPVFKGGNVPNMRYHDTPLWHQYIGKNGDLRIKNTEGLQKALSMITPYGTPPKKPRSRGRQKGGGAYNDSKFVKKMAALIKSGKSKSKNDAAFKISKEAPGAGTRESIQKRLFRKYNASVDSK